MAPSIARLGTVALAYASGVVATSTEAYKLKESYTPSNFFDKFNFFADTDPNGGAVHYRSRADAKDLGIIEENDNDVRLGVHTGEADDNGRSSVRIESRNTYNGGLFIADFTHFPGKACGSWPAFWMVGPQWPRDGEVDIYEGWNMNERNKVVLHTDDPDVTAQCHVSQDNFEGQLQYSDCWTANPRQASNAGCAVEESNGLWANPDGGVCEWH